MRAYLRRLAAERRERRREWAAGTSPAVLMSACTSWAVPTPPRPSTPAQLPRHVAPAAPVDAAPGRAEAPAAAPAPAGDRKEGWEPMPARAHLPAVAGA